MGKVIRYLGITALAVLFSTAALASVNDDQVTSQKIKEADGTSGQNTNAGSGVKTGHIQDGAVTSGKIADGAVTDAKIAGPISAAKISSAGLNADTVDGMHVSDLAQAVHSHPQSQVTGLEAALAGKADVLHNHDALYQQKYGKVAVVAQTGGDYTDPVSAMNNLGTWCGTPSASNPCLIKMMPGNYYIGDPGYGSALTMQEYVDIEGAGENMTRIISSINDRGGIAVANNSELRFLTAQNEGAYGSVIVGEGGKITNVTVNVVLGGNGFLTGSTVSLLNVTINVANEGRGMYTYGSASLTNVVINCAGGGYLGGIEALGGSYNLRNVTVNVSGTVSAIGIFNVDSGMEFNNVSITSSGVGLKTHRWGSGGTTYVNNSSINGAVNKIVNEPSNSVFVGNSRLIGGPISGDVVCAGTYDGNYTFYANTCL